MIKVGFTGTRDLTIAHATRMVEAFSSCQGEFELHHGDCVGADEYAHTLAEILGWKIVIHPPDNSRLRANCESEHILEPLPYLQRNHAIVDATAYMIAAPRGPEVVRSGTWATVRYARKIGRRVEMIFPEGDSDA